MRDIADGGRDVVAHDDQIVIAIERQVIGIIRTFGEARRGSKMLGKQTLGGEHGCAKRTEEDTCAYSCIQHARRKIKPVLSTHMFYKLKSERALLPWYPEDWAVYYPKRYGSLYRTLLSPDRLTSVDEGV